VPLLSIRNLKINYGSKEVLHNISFVLEPGEILGLIGESGSGKSTLLRAIIGELSSGGAITYGTMEYKNRDLINISEEELRRLLGPEISILFQDSKNAMCQIRKIRDLLYEAMNAHLTISFTDAMNRAKKLMVKIGLTDTDRILHSYPFELSGGMNQRVGLVMAMLLQPALLLTDEPTSALDVTLQKQVIKEIQLMQQTYHMAVIFATHNIALARQITDKILVLKDGEIIEQGNTKDVLRNPQKAYTKDLIEAVPHLRRAND
jgi:ABC-type glutathione transport system ATPase component